MSNIQTLGQVTQNFLNQQKNNQNATAAVAPAVKKPKTAPDYVHPILSKQDFRESIARYNQHIKKYNMEVWMENAKVRDYNRSVRKFRKENKPTLEQRKEEFAWKETHKGLSPNEYNALVEAYNRGGLWLNKKVARQEVKKESEKVFIAIVHQLNMQLFERKRLRIELEVHVPGQLPKVKIYPNKIIQMERDGCVNLPISAESFRHHRKRLQEAGVLLDYKFHGRIRPVSMRLNPEILKVTDNGKPKNSKTENQSVTGLKTKKVLDYNVSSRNNSDKNKIRDKRNFSENGKMDNNCTGTSTRTPNGHSPEKETTGPPMPPLSKTLAEMIEPAEDLSRYLSEGNYNTYKHLNFNTIEKEALHGAMLQDHFKELAIQDIFCFAAVLFRHLNVHPGSWHNAIKIWMEEMFVSPNGHTLSKPIIAERWKKCIKVLKAIKKYQKTHTDWQIRYPSLFFDPQRKHKEESSFEYAYRFFRIEKKPAKTKNQRKMEHYKNTRKATDLKKAQEKAREFLRHKISLDQVYDYVKNNCNREVYENINNIIKKEFEKSNP